MTTRKDIIYLITVGFILLPPTEEGGFIALQTQVGEMEKIACYQLVEKIAQTRSSLVFRARKEGEKRTVIIKNLKVAYPSPSEIARFKQEYSLIKNTNIDGVVKTIEIIEHADVLALVLEDFEGVSLKSTLEDEKIDTLTFLRMAQQMSRILGDIHNSNICHKDVKPANILVNRNNDVIKFTDFGISSIITHENEEIYNREVIEGTLRYISPEQTGRMNRDVDYRTDIYSLGITFYEMLTGEVPFVSSDPMEIIHSQIARQPAPPCEVAEDIPPVISDIVIRMLAKNPEERYQNAFGVMHDIELCLDQYRHNKTIVPFGLGQKDISKQFRIPHALVGRETEVNSLLSSFQNLMHTPTIGSKREIVLVTGPPGIGKSALIHELHKPILEKRGRFIAGKYDQFRKDVPYSAIIQAFRILFKQILTESQENISAWRERLLEKMGVNGKVIIDVIPELELIIGEQPAVLDLPPDESQNRFNTLFTGLISVFTSAQHPLVLFLDDLQWVDTASLQLLEALLLNNDIKYLMLIGSFRDNEVDGAHILSQTLTTLEQQQITINRLAVGPLNAKDVSILLSNLLRKEGESVHDLASLIHSKTSGNPFFVTQFIKNLYDKQFLRIDPLIGWQWQLSEIVQLQVTDNVVELMMEKISDLPEKTVHVLKICAGIGNRFDLATIAHAADANIEEVLSDLLPAIDNGHVGFFDDLYHFHHDRIQEAAYALIDNDQKCEMHYKIGKFLLQKTPPEELFEKAFYLVYHLNKAAGLVDDIEEKRRLVELNLVAGMKAKDSTAYEAAINYFEAGRKIFPSDYWHTHYENAFQIHLALAECLYFSGDHQGANDAFDLLLERAKNNIDRAQVYIIKITLLITVANYEEATQQGIDGLKMFGVNIPPKPSKFQLLTQIIRLKWFMRNKTAADLAQLPRLEDKEKLALTQVGMAMSPAAFFQDKNLLALLSLIMMNIMVRNGNSNESPFGYSSLGTIFLLGMGDYDNAERYGELGLELSKKMVGKGAAQAVFVYAWTIQHWQKHAKEDLPLFRDAYRRSLEVGNLTYACHSINNLGDYAFVLDNNLDEVYKDYLQYEDFVKRMKDPFISGSYNDNIRVYLALKGETDSLGSMNNGDYYEEQRLEEIYALNNSIDIFLHLIVIMKLRYLAGDYESALKIAVELEKNKEEATALIQMPEYYFYYSLVLTALYPNARFVDRNSFRKRIVKHQKLMKKWAARCPENFRHKYLLVDAEFLKNKGKQEEAIARYKEAIQAAADGGYNNNRAIAHELLGRYYLSLIRKHAANGENTAIVVNGANISYDAKDSYNSDNAYAGKAAQHLLRAQYFFKRWGALAKADEIEKRYREVFEQQKNREPVVKEIGGTYTISTVKSSEHFDVSSALKASQAISGEIVLGSLLKKLIVILMENAGAEKGLLILETDGILTIEARCHIDDNIIEVLGSRPVETSQELSQAIVQYAARTQENVILNDAVNDAMYSNDDYIKRNRPKSILCAPIINQGRVSALLYLENNKTRNAFVPERLALLSVLSSQAAVSIDNARLYAQLEEKVAKRTEELEAARDALWGEMELAAKIQTALLPEECVIPGYDIFGHMVPASEVGGDYYDVINGSDQDWVLIGDVSGHGVPAGLIMMMVQTSVQLVVRNHPTIEPNKLLGMVNRSLAYNIGKLEEEKYMTIVAMRMERDGQVVHAGLHLDLLIYRAASDSVETIETNGIWLGLDFDIDDMNSNQSFKMNPGDVLLLSTDGITEATDSKNNMFTRNSLEEVLKTSASHSAAEIGRNILEALDGYQTEDDVTLMVLKRKEL